MKPNHAWCLECVNRCSKCKVCVDLNEFRPMDNPKTFTMIDIVEKDEYGLRNKKIRVDSKERATVVKSDWVPPFLRDTGLCQKTGKVLKSEQSN